MLATISGSLAVSGCPIIVCWLVPVVVGIAVAGLMGWIVAYLRIPSIVVTLGMLSILKGGLISVTGGAWITNLPPGYALAQMRPLGVPMPVWFMVVLTGARRLLDALQRDRPRDLRGRRQRRGGAPVRHLAAAHHHDRVRDPRLVRRHRRVLFATQLSVIQSTVPPNLELTIITASVVGGVSILGGTGTVIGSTLAAILLAAIGSSLIFVNISPYWLRAVQGVLILVTVLADLMRRRRQARSADMATTRALPPAACLPDRPRDRARA